MEKDSKENFREESKHIINNGNFFKDEFWDWENKKARSTNVHTSWQVVGGVDKLHMMNLRFHIRSSS